MKKSKTSTGFFGVGPFAKHRDEIANFGSNMYLSYAILEILQKQKNERVDVARDKLNCHLKFHYNQQENEHQI